VILTVGHSTHSIAEFLEILRAHGVTRILDVRTVPRSARNPQFNRESLPGDLAAAGIAYAHLPELGGLRKARADSRNLGWQNEIFRGYADYMQTLEFAAALERVIAIVARREAESARLSALMCAEGLPWRCHRSLIADALTARGVPVVHIMGTATRQPHGMTPFAYVEGTRVTYPALGL
jgi:uncharacterized protein (DUF488 family)